MEYELTNEYRLTTGYKIFYGFFAFLFFTGMLFLWGNAGHSKLSVAGTVTICCMLGIPVIAALANFRRKVVVGKDGITSTGLFTTTQLPLVAIKGRRNPYQRMILEPVSAAYPRMVIGNYGELTNSNSLVAWINASFPDLDAADLETAQQQLLQDKVLGDTATNRQLLLERAKTIVPVYNTIACIAAFFCAVFGGQVAGLLMLLLPLAGIFLLFTHRGLIKFFSVSSRSIYPAVFYGIGLGSLLLCEYTVFYYNLLQWQHLLLPAFLIAAITGWLLYKKGINPAAGQLKGQIVLIAVASIAYGVGSTRLLNCAFDQTRPTAYPAVIKQRFISYNSSGKSYYFVLAPWGPSHSSAQVEVGRLLYRVIKVGDTVTVKLKQGLLLAPWYWVEQREDNLIEGKNRN